MKSVVLAELQRFVLRPNVSESSQYYACVFMNQVRDALAAHGSPP